MLTIIPGLLAKADLAAITADIAAADWADGRATAGARAAAVKLNRQLAPDDPVALRWAPLLQQALARQARFISAALPLRTLPPLFSRYDPGDHYGLHVDNAIRPAGQLTVRTDVAATLFLSDPASYDGGALHIETSVGPQRVKLNAGDLLLYPATTRHQVEPITRGVRFAAIFWAQSMVRDAAARALLFDLDETIQALAAAHGQSNSHVVTLTGTYHNLIRMWGET
jgi:PKHD-type hydroxylase